MRFIMVGTTGMVVDIGTYSLLLLLLPFQPARALAIWVAMTWNFFLNRRITFAAPPGGVFRQYLLFCTSCLLGALVNWAVSVGLCHQFAFFDEWKPLSAVAGVIAGTGFNYALCRLVVFRHVERAWLPHPGPPGETNETAQATRGQGIARPGVPTRRRRAR